MKKTKEQNARREYVRPEERARKQSIYPLTVGKAKEAKVSYAECVQTVCLGLNKMIHEKTESTLFNI
ncbi:MAG: hypothetical protein II950_05775 [Prevotella sp.]|nr:hypothetical protein [Prevotella sp.]